jgi:hypothetical protein
MKREEALQYKIGDRVEVFRSSMRDTPVDWTSVTASIGTVYLLDYDAVSIGTVYLLDYDANMETYFVLVKCDKRIHTDMSIDGYGYYIFNSNEIRKHQGANQ